MSIESYEERLHRLERLHAVGIALAAENDSDRLMELILLEAKALCRADAGTLYLRSEQDTLCFTIMHTDSLGVAMGGTTGKDIRLPPIPLFDPETGRPNHHNVASHAVLLKQSVNIPDAYDYEGDLDFSGTRSFDLHNNYRSKSFLTIPLCNQKNRVLGVLQLINAKGPEGELIPFSAGLQETVETLASQAAVILDNKLLVDAQAALLESFIKLIAEAIDAKSPYTGAHCGRVPVLTEMLARAACDSLSPPFTDFVLSDEEWYELHIAAWLHDCGKVTTPVHVMDKATKLETIFDRIEVVRARFEVLRREVEVDRLEGRLRGDEPAAVDARAQAELAQIEDDLAFLETVNLGGEYLDEEKKGRVRQIGARSVVQGGVACALLGPEEVDNLCISRGTLNREERIVINGHMSQTIKMLQKLPFPRHLKRVPEYAGGHHEKMDGSGYPRGLYAGDMSIPARIMAIADVFEALTAQDRPYKPGKTLSQAMRIMGFMKKDNHLDPHLFDLFVRSGIFREYGARFLPEELLDEVDVQSLLDIEPRPFELPPVDERMKRWIDFLPDYQ
ncbi:MAG: HD domain-containing phosphohydrolase [Myxococcota bacterium]|nr:HD domain-containing phosphohydrolase [Myxococcota bacterium]